MRARAFTLIELIVVIAIIGLLALIMMPALSKARAAAQQVVCTTHVRAIVLGCRLYAQDNDDFLPYSWLGVPDPPDPAIYQEEYYAPWWRRVGGFWVKAGVNQETFPAYVPYNPHAFRGTIWTCPFVDRGEIPGKPWLYTDAWSMHYAMNDLALGFRNAHWPVLPTEQDWRRPPRKLSRMRPDLPLISDSPLYLYQGKDYFVGQFTAQWQGQIGDWDNLAPWQVDRATGRVLLHDGHIPLGAVDGSVENVSSLTPQMLQIDQ